MATVAFLNRPGMQAHAHALAALKSLQFPHRMEREEPKARPDEIEAQVEVAIELNHELFWQWYGEATARTERRSTTVFDFTGPISDCELVQLQFNVHSTPEQHRAAGMELRARFTSDNYAELERRAIEARGE